MKASILPAAGIIEVDKPLDVLLQVNNPTRLTAEVKGITLSAPIGYVAFVKDRGPPPSAQTVPAGGSLAIPLQLAPGNAIPGSYTLVLGYQVAFPAQSAEWQAGAATSNVSIEVRGVSDTLQLIGIPSLLLIPGALVLYTFLALFAWLLGTQRGGSETAVPVGLRGDPFLCRVADLPVGD